MIGEFVAGRRETTTSELLLQQDQVGSLFPVVAKQVVSQIEGDRRIEIEGRDIFLLEPGQSRGLHKPAEGFQRGFDIFCS